MDLVIPERSLVVLVGPPGCGKSTFAARSFRAAGRLTVVDATNVQPLARRPLIELARRYHRVPVAIVFDLPEEICQEWNRRRGRVVPRRAVHRHAERLRGSRDLLEGEGFEVVHVLRAPDEIDRARVVRAPSG